MDCGNRGGAGIGCAFRSGLYKREGAFPNYSCAIAGNREHAEHRASSVSRLHVSLRDRIAAVVGCHHRGGGDGKKENLKWSPSPQWTNWSVPLRASCSALS